MRAKICFGLSLLLVLLCPTISFAKAEIGGGVETKTKTLITKGGNFETLVQESLTLELLIPEAEGTSAYAKFDFNTNQATSKLPDKKDKLQLTVEKLYVKHNFDRFAFSVGRQPISWSFGSLLNPVDYNLGAKAMQQTRNAKYVDAVEVYYPINWNTGITGVTSLANEEVKYGIRGRTLFKGYDLTANYVQRGGGKKKRVGVTAKGSLGSIGVYGAGSYYLDSERPVYLVGGDYSFFPGRGNHRVRFQLEYRSEMNLLLGLTSYEINRFSSVKLMGIYCPEDSSSMIIPEYSNQLGNGLQVTLRGSWFVGEKKDVLGSQNKGRVELELSYYF